MGSHFFHWLLKGMQDFFVVDARQARGLLVMMLLMVVLVFTPLLVRMAFKASISRQERIPDQQLDLLISQLEQARMEPNHDQSIGRDLPTPSALDPNLADQEALEAVGFPLWMAQRIINYRQAGGVYADKEDMMRLYGMTEEMYGKVESWLRFPAKPAKEIKKPVPDTVLVKSGGLDSIEKTADSFTQTDKMVVDVFEINATDTLQLQAIRGIGPVLASRILRYRDLLGGFSSVEQLREVYGLPPETLERLLEKVEVDTLRVEKTIRINRAEDPAELARHPYLNFREARAIINYRKQHGPYERWEDLKQLYSLADSTLLKIKPYIMLDD